MKRNNCIKLAVTALTLLFTAVLTSSISAAPSAPDLEVQMLGTNNAWVYSPYVYRARVSNTGSADAQNVSLTIDLPLTDTSPTRHILGNLSGVDSNCQVVSNKLECSLGKIKAGKQKTVRFTFELPVSTKTLSFTGTSATAGDANPANNSATKTPGIRFPNNSISSANILNSHCTGQGLTSYFECSLFPSSLNTHEASLDQGGLISFAFPGYSGVWSQPTSKELHMTYYENGTTVLEFEGYAVSATCFEGLSTFPQNSQWVSPYRVCVQ